QLVSKARQAGLFFSVKDVFQCQTVYKLSQVLTLDQNTSTAYQGLVTGSAYLSPIQHWFFEKRLSNPHHFNQSVLLSPSKSLNIDQLQRAFDKLLSHHDALRMRYTSLGEQTFLKEESLPICSVKDLSSVSKEEFLSSLETDCSLLQASLNIERGPLIKVCLFNGPDSIQRVFIVIHHLVVDGVSWRILLEDLTSLLKGEDLPLKTHSYQQWTLALKERSSSLEQESSYWSDVLSHINPLKTDFTNNSISSMEGLSVSLSKELTHKLVHAVPKAYRTEINDILLTALSLSFGGKLSLSLEGHGREEDCVEERIDLSRTIGWFTSLFPVNLSLENTSDLGECIKTVKETLRGIPHKGAGYGVLRYIHKTLESHTLPPVSFNYLGQWDNKEREESLLSHAYELTGSTIDPNNAFDTLIDINGDIREGILSLHWAYSCNHYQRETIHSIAQKFINQLELIIDHCLNNYGYTPSDFSFADLSQDQINTTVSKLPYVQDIYPLSPMQEGFLFQSIYQPDSDAYFVQLALDLEGDVHPETFKKAFQKVAEIHPILRTGFIWKELDKPLQYVLENIDIPFTVEETQDVEAFIQKDRQTLFDLSKAPLFRVALLKRAENSYTLVWSNHHILTDGWSSPVILNDLFQTYEELSKGNVPVLKARPLYRDYIEWIQKQDKEKAKEFWLEYLKDIEGRTSLSFKGICIEDKETDYRKHGIRFTEEETKQLEEFAQNEGITLNTLLQGAVGKLLYHYVHQKKLVIGVTVSGRDIPLPGIEEMVGLFINTLPVRFNFSEKLTAREYLQKVQDWTQQVNEYSYTPLADVQSWANNAERLFDVHFVFENYPVEENTGDKEGSIQITGGKGVEKSEYPLTIIVARGKELRVEFNYQTEHFDEIIIEKIGDQIQFLLKELLKETQQEIHLIPYLPQREQEKVLVEWNQTEAEYPKDKTIHQLFEEQVEKNPKSTALVFEEEEMSYG
ncbi:MAG: condensation domain-containing protein, partial [Burkholderiaceae bacterium]